MSSSNNINSYQFLLDILEDQKQKKTRLEFVREEMAESLTQELIDELKNMTELDDDDDDDNDDDDDDDDDDDEAKENNKAIQDATGNNHVQKQYRSNSQFNLTASTTRDHSKLKLLDERLDPILQNGNNKLVLQEPDQAKFKPRTKRKANPNQNQKAVPNKRSKSESDRKSNPLSNPRKGKKPNLNRDHRGANQRLMHDFFQLVQNNTLHQEQPQDLQYRQDELDSKFYSQFLLSKKLFLKIVNDLTQNDLHFTQRKDALGNLGHSSYQKVLVAFRQLTHGIGNQQVIMDDYIRMADSTALECLIRFCHNINELYGSQYLRSPNELDLRRINENNLNRGIPSGFVASLSFKYWQWDNRPTGWSGRFKTTSSSSSSSSSKPLPTIVLEALVSPDSWFWYAFFSTPGNCKDIDIFHPNLPIYSPKFQPPQFSSPQHSSQLITAYYHAHSIYPPIRPIISSINSQIYQNPVLVKQERSKLNDDQFQSLCRDDFDRAIDKLESRFQIIKLPCRLWSSNSMKVVIMTVMILHNMIMEDERIHGQFPKPTEPNSIINRSSQSDTTTTQSPMHHDIQVNPLLSDNTHQSQSPPIIVPPHVLQKLNDRFKLFNPNLSLRF